MTKNQQTLGQIMFMNLMMGRVIVPASVFKELIPDIKPEEVKEFWNMIPESPPFPNLKEPVSLQCPHPKNLMFWLFFNCGISNSLSFNAKAINEPAIAVELTNQEEALLACLEDADVDAYVRALCYYRTLHPHQSNWIKYDENEIFKLAGLKPEKKKEVYKKIREKYPDLIEFRVMGKNTPISCFKLNITGEEES